MLTELVEEAERLYRRERMAKRYALERQKLIVLFLLHNPTRLREARGRRSQQEVADALDVPRQYISYLENGLVNRINDDVLIRMLKEYANYDGRRSRMPNDGEEGSLQDVAGPGDGQHSW